MEVIPAPWTDPEVVVTTTHLLEEAGQVPVLVKKEIDGFVLNRIQYAIIGECWRLYEVRLKSLHTPCHEILPYLNKLLLSSLVHRFSIPNFELLENHRASFSKTPLC